MFATGAPDYAQPSVKEWKVAAPNAGSRQPLRLDFDEPLDYALLNRVLEVIDDAGTPILGKVAIGNEERSWSFTPDAPWNAGRHAVQIGTELEDLAGNSFRKPFEAGESEAEDKLSLTPLGGVIDLWFDVRPPQ
ncbi:MAG: Ig-like domain-containing protein [Verrucomicrobiales bacterium]